METFANTSAQIAKLTSPILAGTANKIVKVDTIVTTAFPTLATEFRVIIDSEIMRVTAGSGTLTWTVERGLENTAAAAHPTIGTNVFHKLTAGALEAGLATAAVNGPEVVTSKLAPEVTIVAPGKLKPNLTLGRVFPVKTSTVPVIIETPINPPAAGGVIYIEIPVVGNKTITAPAASKWLFGGEPQWDYSSSSAVNVVTLVSYDDGVTWYGVGAEGLPASVVKASGVKAGESVKMNPGETAWEPYVPITSSGLTSGEVKTIAKNEADAEIAAKTIEKSDPQKLVVEGAPTAGAVLLTRKPIGRKLKKTLVKGEEYTALEITVGFNWPLWKGQKVKLVSGTHEQSFTLTADVAASGAAVTLPVEKVAANFAYPELTTTVEEVTPSGFEYYELDRAIYEKSPRRALLNTTVITASEVVRPGAFYLVSKAGVTLTLASLKETGVTINIEGDLLGIKNTSTGFITVTGEIDQEVSAVSISVGPGETIVFTNNAGPKEYRVVGSHRPFDPWTELTLGAKAQQVAGATQNGSRWEQGGSVARLRGQLEVIGGTLSSPTTFATVTTGRRPQKETPIFARLAASPFITPFNIAANGAISLPTGATALVVGTIVSFDNVTYPLT